MPPEGFDFLRYRFGLGVMLAVASAGVDGYRTAQELLGLQPVHGNRLASFTARLREHRVLEPVAAAICQLARKLDEHGAPIDYARRRRLRRSPRPSSTSPAGGASRTSSPAPAPGHTAVTSTARTCPPPRYKNTSPGSA